MEEELLSLEMTVCCIFIVRKNVCKCKALEWQDLCLHYFKLIIPENLQGAGVYCYSIACYCSVFLVCNSAFQDYQFKFME